MFQRIEARLNHPAEGRAEFDIRRNSGKVVSDEITVSVTGLLGEELIDRVFALFADHNHRKEQRFFATGAEQCIADKLLPRVCAELAAIYSNFRNLCMELACGFTSTVVGGQ